jgi:hypothetical protein
MALTSGIEQQAARSLTGVHHPPSPRSSIELRRIKHPNADIDIKDLTSVRVNEPGGPSAPGDRVQTVSPKTRKRLEIQYACLCTALFLAGWNDGTNGHLIPRIQLHYNVKSVMHTFPFTILNHRAQVNFTLVSLIFIANSVVRILSGKIFQLMTLDRGLSPVQPQTLFSLTKWDSAR